MAARFLRDSNATGKPCSAFVLANAAGLYTRHIRRGQSRGPVGDVIYLDERGSAEWQEAFVLRCVARWALQWYREPVTDASLAAFTRALRRRPQEMAGRELSEQVG